MLLSKRVRVVRLLRGAVALVLLAAFACAPGTTSPASAPEAAPSTEQPLTATPNPTPTPETPNYGVYSGQLESGGGPIVIASLSTESRLVRRFFFYYSTLAFVCSDGRTRQTAQGAQRSSVALNNNGFSLSGLSGGASVSGSLADRSKVTGRLSVNYGLSKDDPSARCVLSSGYTALLKGEGPDVLVAELADAAKIATGRNVASSEAVEEIRRACGCELP